MRPQKIEFEIEGTAVFRDGSENQRSGTVLYPYRRYTTQKVDGLPLIPRACDVPPPGVPVGYRAHKNRKGTVWCCHIDPSDLPEGCSLAGRFFHEELTEQFKPSEAQQQQSFAPRCRFNGGPVILFNREEKPANGKWWYRPGFHLVWIVSATQLSDGQIVLVEGEDEETENPLTIRVNGQERGVYLVLGFIEVDPKHPPRPGEVRMAYVRMLDATKGGSAPVLRILVDRGDITEPEAARLMTDAGERRYVLHQAYRKAYAHAVSVHGPEKRTDRLSFEAPMVFDLAERVAKTVRRRKQAGQPASAQSTPQPLSGDILIAEVVAAVSSDRHFAQLTREQVTEVLSGTGGVRNCAQLLQTDENVLKGILSHSLVGALKSAGKKLQKKRAQLRAKGMASKDQV